MNPPSRILVVEDDGDLRRLISEVLSRSGYEVETAANGVAAWEALSTESYDLMITDNGMPKLTGIELLKKLRADRMVMPVIMATGVLPTHEFARSPWLVPDATLVKPYTIDELVQVVETVLRTSDPSPSAEAPGDPEADRLPPGVESRDNSIPQYEIKVNMHYPESVLHCVGSNPPQGNPHEQRSAHHPGSDHESQAGENVADVW